MIERIMIDRVREQTSIAELIGESVQLHPRGRSLVGRCPFHQETTPSLHVNPERGIFHCRSCGEFGDVFAFLQRCESISFDEAVARLAQRAGITLEEPATDLEQAQRRRALYQVSEAAADFFERMLREHPLRHAALEELARRGLQPDPSAAAITATLQAFRIGYAPHGWETLSNHLRDAGLSLQAAEAVGLVVPRRTAAGYYDRFRHRLMFAVLDLQGRVIAFSGRSLREPTDGEQARLAGATPSATGPEVVAAKYVNSPESPIYRKREAVFGLHQARHSVRAQQQCIVVEGNFDVVGLHARGISNAVAPLGTAFTLDQARLIRRLSPVVVFMFDADAAGRRDAAAARGPCQLGGLVAKVATLPEGEDPDDVVRSQGPAAIRHATATARGMLEYLIDSVLDRGFAADDAQARAAKIHEVADLLASETDPTVQRLAEQQANRVAERLGIADARTLHEVSAAVRRALSRATKTSQPTNGTPNLSPQQARSRDLSGQIGYEILGTFLDYPELLSTQEFVEGMKVVDDDVAIAIAAARQCRSDEKAFDLQQLLAKLASPIHSFAAARLAAPRHEQLDDARTKLLDNVNKLKRLQLKCSSSEVEELQRAAASGDFDAEIALLREHERRARKRHGF